MGSDILAAGVPPRYFLIGLGMFLTFLQIGNDVLFPDRIAASSLAAVCTVDFAASQQVTGSLFADMAQLMALLHIQRFGNVIQDEFIFHCNTPQTRFVGAKPACALLGFCSFQIFLYGLLSRVLSVLPSFLSKIPQMANTSRELEYPVILGEMAKSIGITGILRRNDKYRKRTLRY